MAIIIKQDQINLLIYKYLLEAGNKEFNLNILQYHI